MRVRDKVVVVTGAAGGIGRALALRFAAEGAAGVVLADLDETGARAVAEEIGERAVAVRADVSVEAEVAALAEPTPFGPVDVFCSNAGIIGGHGLDAPLQEWTALYAVTKAAAVAFAEWLAIHYASRGIKVSVLCPQGVRTGMLERGVEEDHLTARAVGASGAILDPADVAAAVVDGLAAERFHILPHPEVAEFHRRKAESPDRWLAAMSAFVDSLQEKP